MEETNVEIYSKDSPEYLGNGHYKINGVEFMSVWTFKNKHNLPQKSQNPNEGKELSMQVQNKKASKPDFGLFKQIYIYPVSDLEDYYGI
jgi:hypothetical protein